DVTKWVQGEPVVLDQLVGKKVVVVSFWATWSEPSKRAIPRLSKLADKWKDALEVVGISDDKAEDIEAFAKDGKVHYHVACDAQRNTHGPYLEQTKVPRAFVIDKTGAVVWSGASVADVECVVDRVMTGKLDAEKAKSLVVLERKLADMNQMKAEDEAVKQ